MALASLFTPSSADDEGHILLDGDVEQVACVQPLGHGQQQEETSVGTGPGNALGHVLGQILVHQVSLVTVELDGLLEVPVIVAFLHVAGGHLLVEDRGAEVGGLLGHDETVDDLLRCEYPAQTETGHECLRECAEQHHSLGSHRIHGRV